jgi:ribosome-binding protein aMBF1 (putative translation factor)
MGNHAVPDYKNPQPLVITLRLSRYPSQTLGQCIRKARLEQGLSQVVLAKKVGVNEMTIVNWEKEKTKPHGQRFEKVNRILGSIYENNRDQKD